MQGGQLSPLLYKVYSDDLNHHHKAIGVGCYVGGAWINSPNYADDILVCLQILLEVCGAYAGPHDIVYNTTKTVCLVVCPKQSKGRYSTRVRLGDEEISYVDEFRYLGHVMTAECRDKDIKKKVRRQNAVGNMLVRKFSFAPMEAKIQLFKLHCYPIYE